MKGYKTCVLSTIIASSAILATPALAQESRYSDEVRGNWEGYSRSSQKYRQDRPSEPAFGYNNAPYYWNGYYYPYYWNGGYYNYYWGGRYYNYRNWDPYYRVWRYR
jgi:hypothetical protein